MIKILDTSNINFYKNLKKIINIRKRNINYKNRLVLKIINEVKKNGDKALIKYEKKFNLN